MLDFRDKRVTVAGLGRFGGGIEVSRWLASQGAQVRVTDKEPADKLADSVKKLEGLPIEFRLGEHRSEDFTSPDLVVTSPAIPPTSEYLRAAQQAGVPITTEIRLFLERCPAKQIVGVTGTKGKSTTTTLLGLMLRSRFKTWVGGNIGGSLLDKLPQISRHDLVVLELSSYMLEHIKAMQWSPHVALVTMISSDHLAWHGSAEAYLDAKRNLVRFQAADDVAILGEDNPDCSAFSKHTKARVIYYGTKGRRPFELKIAGQHNQLNAQAAFAAAGVFGITWDQAQAAVRDFPGLPHRLELVHEADGVRYYNDSIATIPEAAVAALESFPGRRVIQIVGGYDKHLPIDAMCDALARQAKAVLCIGEIGPKIAIELRSRGANVVECETLDNAMTHARESAGAGDVVLLSTGCASYDQFVNFEARGDAFTKLARLPH